MIEVTLTPFEMELAAGVGVRRFVDCIANNRVQAAAGQNRWGDWQQSIEGACGELAVAKALGRYWNGSVNTFMDGGDVGAGLQVRTRSRHDYDLIVRDKDRDTDYFVLVTGSAPTYRVHGFALGGSCKRAEWRRDHGGHGAAYFVPQASLTPLVPKAQAA